jgi:hypothetical protein
MKEEMEKMNKGYYLIAIFCLAVMTMWSMKANAQNQLVTCDSLGWTQYPVTGLSITLDTTNAMVSPVDSVVVGWSVCDNQICYSGSGMTGYFPYVNMSDTVKVCISTEFWYVPGNNQIIEYCYTCDSIAYNGNDWVSIYDSNTVGIEELILDQLNDNKIYDLLGRELLEVPVGQMYIQNRKKYIKTI